MTIRAYRNCAFFDESEINKIIDSEWRKTIILRPNIALDEYVIMPNHFHGIIIFKRNFNNVGAYCNTPLHQENKTGPEHKFKPPSQDLGAIIRGFKGATTKKVNLWRLSPNMPLWQRNYHERIIRNEAEFAAYRKYIRGNPANWDKDELNPVNIRNGGQKGYQ